MRFIVTTPRALMEQGVWEKAREIAETACGQWVYDSGLKSLDDPIILTAAEAGTAGFEPPRRSAWQKIAEWLPWSSAGWPSGTAPKGETK